MDDRIRKIFICTVMFTLFVISLFIILYNPDNRGILFIFCSTNFISFCVRVAVSYRTNKRASLSKIILYINFAIIYYISFIDISRFSQLYYFCIVAETLIFYFGRRSIAYFVWGLISLILTINLKYCRWNYFDPLYILPSTLEMSFYFTIVSGLVYLTIFQVNQSGILKKAMQELKNKTLELEGANEKLRLSMLSLEEMATLKERNRIAGEIHDVIGHTLTTVLVEIEAGKKLIGKDADLAANKLELAQQQVRTGLEEIRRSVKMLKERNSFRDFITSVKLLVEETEKHTGVSIKWIIGHLPTLTSEQERVIFRAIQEGLTNGIRHGNSDFFVLKLQYSEGKLHMTLRDNGKGSSTIVPGFGLNNMGESIKKLGGSLSIISTVGQGSSLKVELPIMKEENDIDTSSNSR